MSTTTKRPAGEAFLPPVDCIRSAPVDTRQLIYSADDLYKYETWTFESRTADGRVQILCKAYQGMITVTQDTGSAYILKKCPDNPNAENWNETNVKWEKIGSGGSSGGGIDVKEEDGVLILSANEKEIVELPDGSSINDLLDAKADNIPFTGSNNPGAISVAIGGFKVGDSLQDMTLQDILKTLLNIHFNELVVENTTVSFVETTSTYSWTAELTNPNPYSGKVVLDSRDLDLMSFESAIAAGGKTTIYGKVNHLGEYTIRYTFYNDKDDFIASRECDLILEA